MAIFATLLFLFVLISTSSAPFFLCVLVVFTTQVRMFFRGDIATADLMLNDPTRSRLSSLKFFKCPKWTLDSMSGKRKITHENDLLIS